ncbi:hypothetical protein, partial [Caenispirillum bisanense]|uniref:hypothetical protein n=1 Tax=Caenispirillum bisanense TaxID=414052 RepID=UPI0031D8AD62
MVEMVLSLALPFLVAVAVAGVLRLSAASGGAAGRLGGAGLVAGFLGWWLWARGLSPAVGEVLHLAPHVMLGGLLLGAVADGWLDRRPPAWAVAALFAVVCLWALAGRPVAAAELGAQGLTVTAGPAALWLLVTLALSRRIEAAVAAAPLLLLAVACLGLAAPPAALGQGAVAGAALALAAATLGLLVWGPAVTAAPGWIVTLGGGGTFVTLAAALLAATPAAAAMPASAGCSRRG